MGRACSAPLLAALGGTMNPERRLVLAGSLVAILLSFVSYLIMPVFAAGGVFLAFLSALLAAYFASIGAIRTASVAAYFVAAACLPFVVSRESTFFFERGYLMLAPGGVVFAALLLLLGRCRADTT